MADTPDFAALRAARNAAVRKAVEKTCAELGWPIDEVKCSHNDNACYCACATGGPCEHDWNGEPYESEDGSTWSATCSKCGCTAMSHDMRRF